MTGANKLAIQAAREGLTVDEIVARALRQNGNSIPAAARALDISKQGLYLHLKKQAERRAAVSQGR